MDENVSPLTAHLGFWMRMVSNQISQSFAAKVAGRGVTVAEWAVMRALLGREPLAPSQLAGEMGLSRGAISKLCDRLVAKGLVSRAGGFEDGRARRVGLTAAGAALVPELAQLADRNDAEFFGCLSEEEREALGRLLRMMVERRGISAVPVD